MAMLPFCGYHMGDYWQHWLDMGKKASHPPKIFNVNWFRTDENGEFIWPGFGDNLRVLEWILKRAFDEVGADEAEIGYLPKTGDINLQDTDVDDDTMRGLLDVDKALWKQEVENIKGFYDRFEGKVPKELIEELSNLEARLNT